MKKVFKTGAAFDDNFYENDVLTVKEAGELIARFNQQLMGKSRLDVKLNKCQV